jgi:hypothetical protein
VSFGAVPFANVVSSRIAGMTMRPIVRVVAAAAG